MKLANFIQVFIASIGIIPLALLFYGYRGYQRILSQNQCEMTYSYPFQYETKLEWKKENFKLLQVALHAGDEIDGHPVLFIPGHKGR